MRERGRSRFGPAEIKVVERIEQDDDSRQRIKVTTGELLQERALVLELVGASG